MSKAVIERPKKTAAVAERHEQPGGFSAEKVALIKETIAKGQNLTDAEFGVFLHVAERTGLDPLARQLYAIKRQGKMTIQTAIDGYRVIAARSGQHAGTEDAVFSYANATPGANQPSIATVTVYRIVQGNKCSFTASARWAEYCPPSGQDHMWRKMPHGQLAKVAEALALRKAFPMELSSVYVAEEMHQAGVEDAEYSVRPAAEAKQPAKAVQAAPEWEEVKGLAELVDDIYETDNWLKDHGLPVAEGVEKRILSVMRKGAVANLNAEDVQFARNILTELTRCQLECGIEAQFERLGTGWDHAPQLLDIAEEDFSKRKLTNKQRATLFAQLEKMQPEAVGA